MPISEEAVQAALSRYSPADAVIESMRVEYLALRVSAPDDQEGFAAVHGARMVVKTARVDVEKTRKALKADALEFGRRVDGEAKRLTALLLPIEEHLEGQEQIVLDERERLANLERVQREAAERRAREEAEAKKRAELEAERAQLAEQRRAQEEEHRKLELERWALQEVERTMTEKLDAERAALETLKDEAERARRAWDETQNSERARVGAEAGYVSMAELAGRVRFNKERAAEIEALRPDIERVLSFADEVEHLPVPQVHCRGQLLRMLKTTADAMRALVQEVTA